MNNKYHQTVHGGCNNRGRNGNNVPLTGILITADLSPRSINRFRIMCLQPIHSIYCHKCQQKATVPDKITISNLIIKSLCKTKSILQYCQLIITVTSRLVFTARLHPQFGMPRASIAAHRRFNQNIPQTVVLLQQCHCRNRHRGKLQNLSPLSVLFEPRQIFLQYTGDTDAKMMDQNLKLEFCDF